MPNFNNTLDATPSPSFDKPNNKCSLADATHHQHGINPNCGDEITLSLKLNNNIIEHPDALPILPILLFAFFFVST